MEVPHKVCSKCQGCKSIDSFSLKSDRKSLASWCKDCNATAARERHKRFPEKTAKANRKQALKRYGLTQTKYDKLLKSQDFGCAVCGEEFHTKTKRDNLAVDHCHQTGKVRGLLCNRCNYALGLVDDDSSILLKLASYLNTDGLTT